MRNAYYKMKMTLDEIRKSMPELQGKVADLTTKKESFTSEISKLTSEEQDLEILIADDKEAIENCKKFISANQANKNPRIASKVADRKKQQVFTEKKLKDKLEEVEKIKKEKAEIEKKPEYAEIEKKLSEAKGKLDEIYDVLEQDPTINAQLQLAVKYKFKTEIDKQKALKENYLKLGKDLSEAMKDGSKDTLKPLIENLIKSKEEREKADNDLNADSNSAKKKYFEARKNVQEELKNRFGIKAEPKDVDYILNAVSKNQLDNLMLPSATVKIQEVDSVIAKLEASRDARLTELEAKKATPKKQNEALIEENREKIEEFKNGIDTILTPKIEALDAKIEDLDVKIDSLDKEITKEEADLGEPSEDYKNLKEIEQELKDNHIIIEDFIPDLEDEDSDINKLFTNFTNADLEVRKAFQKCKVDDTPEALEELKDRIEEYKLIAEEIQDYSGYDIESWQNYLKETLNDRIEDGETIDSAYYHTDNESLIELEKDETIRKNDDALDAYDELFDKTKEIDKAQKEILNGNFGAVMASVDGLFTDPDKGYYKAIQNLGEKTGLEKGLADGLNIFDLLKNSKLIKPGAWNKVKGFFKNLASKFSPKRFFEPPKGAEGLIKKYNKAKTPEVKEEIEARSKVENLKRELTTLESDKAFTEMDIKDLVDRREQATKVVTDLETKNEELAKEDATRTATSKLEQTEDLEFVTREDSLVEMYTDSRMKDDDDGR